MFFWFLYIDHFASFFMLGGIMWQCKLFKDSMVDKSLYYQAYEKSFMKKNEATFKQTAVMLSRNLKHSVELSEIFQTSR